MESDNSSYLRELIYLQGSVFSEEGKGEYSRHLLFLTSSIHAPFMAALQGFLLGFQCSCGWSHDLELGFMVPRSTEIGSGIGSWPWHSQWEVERPLLAHPRMKFLFFPTGLDWKNGVRFGIAVIYILTLRTREKANKEESMEPGATGGGSGDPGSSFCPSCWLGSSRTQASTFTFWL